MPARPSPPSPERVPRDSRPGDHGRAAQRLARAATRSAPPTLLVVLTEDRGAPRTSAPGDRSVELHRKAAARASAVARRGGAVLLVGDVAAPSDGAAHVVVLLHGDVDHEPVRGRAMPVVLVGLEENAVAGADDLDRAALALAQTDALGDEDRLAVRVRVPSGARAGREVHGGGGEGRCPGGRGDGVDVDVAGEPVDGALLGFDAVAGDLHACCSRVQASSSTVMWKRPLMAAGAP